MSFNPLSVLKKKLNRKSAPSLSDDPTIKPLHSVNISTKYGIKEIQVYSCSVTDFKENIDILTTSAYIHSYHPIPFTIFEALQQHGISVQALAEQPDIDLRQFCNIWLSQKIRMDHNHIQRIGCIEFDHCDLEESILNAICSYFHMLDIASIQHIDVQTIALPLLGSGAQLISVNLIIVPLFNECINFLKRNPHVKKICFIEKNPEKADLICNYMKQSYNILNDRLSSSNLSGYQTEPKQPIAFISYASEDKNIADNLCAKLESNGIRVWYAPRDVIGSYADAIAKAIDSCTHFIVILSQNSIRSQHVLNEIDLAFQKLPDQIKFKPLRIDQSMFTPSFKYYLSRQHWMDAIVPPLEDRLNEFVKALTKDI